jgi:hypothetical protein
LRHHHVDMKPNVFEWIGIIDFKLEDERERLGT